MAIADTSGAITKIKPHDRLSFNKSNNTISFSRGSNKKRDSSQLFFTQGEIRDKTKPALFIRSTNDFISYAEFISGLLCLSGVLTQNNKVSYIWTFFHTIRGKTDCISPGCVASYQKEAPVSIAIQCLNKLRYQFPSPFIKDFTDFDGALLTVGEIFSCFPSAVEGHENKRIFV